MQAKEEKIQQLKERLQDALALEYVVSFFLPTKLRQENIKLKNQLTTCTSELLVANKKQKDLDTQVECLKASVKDFQVQTRYFCI